MFVDPGRAAELAHPDDQGLVEQPAGGQVVDQGRHGLVGGREEPILELVEVVAVGVPAAGALPPIDCE